MLPVRADNHPGTGDVDDCEWSMQAVPPGLRTAGGAGEAGTGKASGVEIFPEAAHTAGEKEQKGGKQMRLSDIKCRECPYLDRYMYEPDGTCKKIGRYMDKVPQTHPRWCPRAAEEKERRGPNDGGGRG